MGGWVPPSRNFVPQAAQSWLGSSFLENPIDIPEWEQPRA